MKQKKRPASQTEAMKLRWKKRIVFEKGYTEIVRRMDGRAPGSIDLDHYAIRTRGHRLSKSRTETFQVGESDTDLL